VKKKNGRTVSTTKNTRQTHLKSAVVSGDLWQPLIGLGTGGWEAKTCYRPRKKASGASTF